MPHLLVFTPTYGDKMHPDCPTSVEAQQFNGRITYRIGRNNPYPVGHRNVLVQYQMAREMLLEGDYDGLVTVEHDMVIPPDAMQKLWDTKAEVVYGVYLLRHGSNVINAWRYENDRNLGMSLTLYPRELRHYRQVGVGRVCGTGHGCTLFRRSVMERIAFRNGEGNQWAPDLPFAEDALKMHVVSMARFDVPCIHIEDGVRLHPYEPLPMDMLDVVATQNVVARIENHSRRLEAGQQYSLPRVDAGDLIRAGYVAVVEKEPEVKPKARQRQKA